ncbi:hypothetical protein KGA66_14200 [Actinocrinis puniceicyclus]|uniref:Uncharacterized protein n=1 Tax=Actinocrinis puniceicyclus TaxID=977794 RepID=A0A8J8BBM2_9ACTN|nr:hypothetical protein [Actinocrinis puniceicyclus]MBS2964207.1 hypothetical protein [Actinocrinis puniceicyclus]
MDRVQAAALRDLLDATGGSADWLEASDEFGCALRRAPHRAGGLLLAGPADDEPWHLAAHLTDESQWANLPQLAPVLLRHDPPPDAPPHLAAGLRRLESTGRGEALLVVAQRDPADQLLERVDDARRRGARILTVDQSAGQLRSLAHEKLIVPSGPGPLTFDSAQHLVSLAAATREAAPGGLRARLGRWIEAVSGPRVERW